MGPGYNYTKWDNLLRTVKMAQRSGEPGPRPRLRQRPVEFRGLSTHYVEGGDILVSFRYPAASVPSEASFQPHLSDRVKLYVLGARPSDRSLASASVGDAKKHRLCDGGLYRTGSVVIPTATIRELATSRSQRSYVLLYGSGKLREVVGKSQPFIICPQSEYPSMQIRSTEDIETLRAHSPISDNQPLYPKGVGGSGEGISFVMVADSSSLLEGWEALEEEEGEREMEEREEEENGGESLSESESWGEVNVNMNAESLSSSASSYNASSSESEISTDDSQEHSDGEEEEASSSRRSKPPMKSTAGNYCGGMLAKVNEVTTGGHAPYGSRCSANGISTPPCNASTPPVAEPNGVATQTPGEGQVATKSEGRLNGSHGVVVGASRESTSISRNGVQEIPKDRQCQNTSGGLHNGRNSCPSESNSLQNFAARKQLSVPDDTFLKGIDMTGSTVLVEDMTPAKVQMIKNTNKELSTKVRILHDKLHGMARERDGLLVTVGEMQAQVSSLKHDKSELKRRNRKLSEDKATLKGKVKRLESENATVTGHCRKQVAQISHYETQLTTISSENEELQRRLRHVAKKSKRRQESSDHQQHKQKHDKQKTREDPSSEPATTCRRGQTSKSTESQTTAAAHAQYGAFLQRPVIDVYVRDPPVKKGAKFSSGESKERVSEPRHKEEHVKREGKMKYVRGNSQESKPREAKQQPIAHTGRTQHIIASKSSGEFHNS